MNKRVYLLLPVLVLSGFLLWLSISSSSMLALAEARLSEVSLEFDVSEPDAIDGMQPQIDVTASISPNFGLSYKEASGTIIVHPESIIIYTIVYTNSGNEDALNVVISDTLAEHLVYLDGGVYSDPDVLFNIPSVPIGTGGQVSLTVQVADDVPAGTIVTNTATILSSRSEPVVTEPITKLVVTPELHLYKSVTPTVAVVPGSILTYTLVFRNTGNQAATGVELIDPLPDGLVYLSGSGVLNEGTLVWNIGTLSPSVSDEVTFTGMITDGVGEILNLAYLSSDQRGIQSSNSVSTSIDAAVLAVQKSVSPEGNVTQFSQLTYTLQYTSVGTHPVTGGRLLDQLPDGVVYVTGGVYTEAKNAVSFVLPEVLPPGSGGTVSFTVDITATPGVWLNNAAGFFYDQLYPATFTSSAPLVITGTSPFGPVGGVSNRRYVAQSFIAAAPRLSRVGVFVQGFATPYPDISIQLWEDNNGVPDLTNSLLVGSVTTITDEGRRYHVESAYPIHLVLGQKYWVILELQTGTVLGSARVRLTPDDVYADGLWVYSEDNGNTWIDAPSSDTDLDILVEYTSPPRSNTVSNLVMEAARCLSVSPVALSFGKVVDIPTPVTKSLSIGNCAPGAVNWAATNTKAWLTLSPYSGTAPSTVMAVVYAAGLPVGVYTDVITIDGGAVQNSPQHIPVRLQISSGKVFLPLVVRNWPLLPPRNFRITNPSICLDTYTIAWDASHQHNYYVLEEAQTSEFTETVAFTTTIPAVNFAGKTLGYYYYRVKGCTADARCSDYSDTLIVYTRLEAEPNNTRTNPDQANGPILPGYTYCGNFSKSGDLDDYFYFELTASHRTELTLTNIQPGSDYNLVVYDVISNVVGYSGNAGVTPEIISTGLLPPGRYYVRVYNYSGNINITHYYLEFDLPE